MPSVKLERFLQRAQRLYSLPAVALEVLRLTSYPQIDIAALKQCIENDPALASKVLRVVNSSLFGLSCEVADLNQALALLGIKPLKLLVLGFSLSGAMFSRATGRAAARYWRHTLTKAVAARQLSQQLGRLPGEEPFLAALLGSIGMLVLIQELGAPYARLIEQSLHSGTDLAELEIEALGFDHRQLTARLFGDWGLPASLATLVRLAQEPAEIDSLPPDQRAAPLFLHLAGLLADLLVDKRNSVLPAILKGGPTNHPLTLAQLTTLTREVQAEVDQLADLLAIELPPGLDYRDILVQAHEQLSQVAAEVAHELVQAGPADHREASEPLQASNEFRDNSRNEATLVVESGSGQASLGASAAVPDTTHLPDAALLPDTALLPRVAAAVAACRHMRCPLSLLLVEIDNFHALCLGSGPEEAEKMMTRLAALCRGLDQPRAAFLRTGEAGYAMILCGCERPQAVACGNQLVRHGAGLLPAEPAKSKGPTVSIGIATVSLPAKNFSPHDLVDAAARCLDAAQLSGGNKLKSIAVY